MSTPTKLIAIGMVKNEADIIEASIRHNLKVFDHIILVDHASTDGTTQILQRIKEEGLPITLHSIKSNTYNQSTITTQLAYRAITEFKADWVMAIDADEFLVEIEGKQSPREIIQQLSEKTLYKIGWRNYFPSQQEPTEGAPWQRIKLSSDQTSINYYKFLAHKTFFDKFKASVQIGNHGLSINERYNNLYSTSIESRLRLAHYPIRSIEQLKSKILVGWANTLTRTDLKNYESWHWRSLAEQLQRNHNCLTIKDVQEFIARSYADLKDFNEIIPIPRPINIPNPEIISARYNLQSVDSMGNFITNTFLIAQELSALKKQSHSIRGILTQLGKAISGVISDIVFRKLMGSSQHRSGYRP